MLIQTLTIILTALISGLVCEPELDWRKNGTILPVPEKSDCLNADTVNALDMISAIRAQNVTKMSAQEVFDCNPDWCICQTKPNTTEIIKSIWVNQLGYIETESDHPYTGQCVHSAEHCPVIIMQRGYHFKTYAYSSREYHDEDVYEMLLHDYSPVVVYVRSSSQSFQTYSGGILDANDCGGPVDHSLLFVGYGVENGTQYWIARNSWGAEWGENGYIRIVRGKSMCGVGDGGYVAVSEN